MTRKPYPTDLTDAQWERLQPHKSVACVYDRRSRAHTFRTLDTTPPEVDKFLARHPDRLVVIVACANAGWVHDRAAATFRWPSNPVVCERGCALSASVNRSSTPTALTAAAKSA